VKDAQLQRSTHGIEINATEMLIRLLWDFYGRASVENDRQEMQEIARVIKTISRAADNDKSG